MVDNPVYPVILSKKNAPVVLPRSGVCATRQFGARSMGFTGLFAVTNVYVVHPVVLGIMRGIDLGGNDG
jgi:hypothetical protein